MRGGIDYSLFRKSTDEVCSEILFFCAYRYYLSSGGSYI